VMNPFFRFHQESLLVKVGHFVDHMTPIYNHLVVAKTLVKTRSWYGLLFATKWKRNAKIFSVRFPQQLDGCGLMGVMKIWANKYLFNGEYSGFWSFQIALKAVVLWKLVAYNPIIWTMHFQGLQIIKRLRV